jgi:hypothetical protein
MPRVDQATHPHSPVRVERSGLRWLMDIEMEFWRQVFVAAVRSGSPEDIARRKADYALRSYRAMPSEPTRSGEVEG